jgi:hypothetical protein
MGAIIPVSAINKMVIRELNTILLMPTGVIAAEVKGVAKKTPFSNCVTSA